MSAVKNHMSVRLASQIADTNSHYTSSNLIKVSPKTPNVKKNLYQKSQAINYRNVLHPESLL
jgi:hypothetical protein